MICELGFVPLTCVVGFIARIFAGYNKSIRIFDVHRPGREFEQYATLKGKNEGQAGAFLILSILTLNANSKSCSTSLPWMSSSSASLKRE